MLNRKAVVVVALCLLAAIAYPVLRLPAGRFVVGSAVLGVIMFQLLCPGKLMRLVSGDKSKEKPKHWIDSI